MVITDIDNLVRGFRRGYNMSIISMLITNGGNADQRVSRTALKFCMAALPFSFFASIGML